MGEENKNITKVSYDELIPLLDSLNPGQAITVVVNPDLGNDAYMFAVGLEPNREGSTKRYAKIACVRNLYYGKTLDVELIGASNGVAIFRKIKSFMHKIGITIGKYSPGYGVDTGTYNKIMGIVNEEENMANE